MRYSLSLALAICAVVSNAAPVTVTMVTERDTAGVNSTVLANLNLFSQYSAAAYCYSNINDATGTAVECANESGTCPLVEAAGATILANFNTDDSTQGYVASDPTNKLIVIGFQGTSTGTNIIDVLTDLDIIQTESTLCGTANTNDGCRIHNGFLTAMQQSYALVLPVLKTAVAANPAYRIVATGHSLGAAIGALLATQLRNDGYVVDIYNYGQPHVGNADINNYIQSQAPDLGNNFRVTHTNDVVPQIPPHEWIPAWDHYYPEFWIDTDTIPVPAASMEVIDGSLFETSGNEGDTSGWGLLVDVIEGAGAHNTYFGPIDGCDSSAPDKRIRI